MKACVCVCVRACMCVCVCVCERERERERESSPGYVAAALCGRDKTTAYTEACFLGIRKLSPKSTGDTQHHPSAGYNRLTRPSQLSNKTFHCHLQLLLSRYCQQSTRVVCACRLYELYRSTTDVLQCPVCLRVRLCFCMTVSGGACNSWPPPFILITSYQRRAARSHSDSSHVPAQLSALPPHFTLTLSLSFTQAYELHEQFSSIPLNRWKERDKCNKSKWKMDAEEVDNTVT